MRVLAFNVRGFRHGVERVIAAVADERPDLALITECGSKRSLRRFADGMGMVSVAGSQPWFRRRAARNAILVRPPSRVIDHEQIRFSPLGRTYPRGALIATIRHAGQVVNAACVHLGLVERERPHHVRELTNRLAAVTGPVVVGGDLNEDPDREAARWLAERYWDAWVRAEERTEMQAAAGETYPAHEPTSRIDYLFVSEEVRVRRVWLCGRPAEGEASDHLAVATEVSLDG